MMAESPQHKEEVFEGRRGLRRKRRKGKEQKRRCAGVGERERARSRRERERLSLFFLEFSMSLDDLLMEHQQRTNSTHDALVVLDRVYTDAWSFFLCVCVCVCVCVFQSDIDNWG